MVKNPKMNWDRIHKEDLARKHGSEWVGGVSAKAGKKSRMKRRSLGPTIKGCTCGKQVGFVGEHKRTCPMRASARTTVVPKAEPKKPPSLAEFASSIKKAGHQELVRSIFKLELELLKKDPMVSARQRDETAKAIQAFLDEL